MAAAVPAMMMASAAISAVGALSSSRTAASEANANAQIASNNATLARQRGNAAEELTRRRTARALSEQRAAVAQSGFDPSSGSALALQTESAANAELDALTARYEGNLRALSFEQEANNMKARARAARSQGYVSAAGSLLQGASSAYGYQSQLESLNQRREIEAGRVY